MMNLPQKLPTSGKRSKRFAAIYGVINEIIDCLAERTPQNPQMSNSSGFVIPTAAEPETTTNKPQSVIPRWG